MEGAAETAVLVMTDVEGSTRLWHDNPGEMNRAMTRHHRLVHVTIAEHGGWRPVDQGEGDAVFAAFGSVRSAVRAAAEIQRRLAAEPWTTGVELKVRIGIHTGEVFPRDGNLFGDTVNRCARIRGLGHGGQTLVSSAVIAQLDKDLGELTWRDLGEHRMKDLSRPERIYQLQIPGLPSEFPPLKSLDRARHNLPLQTTSLVGREREVGEVRTLLEKERLVTLVGFGGIGKTRLALDVAAALAEGEADGVWFVDLAAVTDPALVPAVIADALSIRESGTGPAQAVFEDLASKRLLLVLDNLEQVLGCAPFLADVLAKTAGVSILATSREPLRIRGEHEYPVETLAPPDAVALFTSRAAAVRPGFNVTGSVGETVVAVCERLDGHPLALELAAARMKVLTADELLARLSSALSVLTTGGRDRPGRHQTLRATIEWSYDALDDGERELLERLAVFPGSFTLGAVEAVCVPPIAPGDAPIDSLDGITALVEKSLLRTVANAAEDQEQRYDMLISVREFAAERLAARGATDELVRRHAQFYAALDGLDADTRDEGAAIVHRAAREIHNLRGAFEWAQRHGSTEDEQSFATFILILVDAGHFEEARAAALHALSRSPVPSAGRVRMHSALGYLYWHTSEEDLERKVLEDQIVEAREVGEPSLLASALIDTLQNCATREELLDQIAEIDTLMASLPGKRNAVPLWYLQELLDNRVSISLRFADGNRALESARSYYAATDFDQFIAGAMLAQLLNAVGDWDGALEVLSKIGPHAGVRWSGEQVERLEGHEDARQGLLQAMWIRLLALALVGTGEVEQGIQHAEAAMEQMSETGMAHWLAVSELALASCYFSAGRLEDARAMLLSAAASDAPGASITMSAGWRLARVDRLLGRRQEARERLVAAQEQHAGKELIALAEILGALVEEVHHVIDEDPLAAVRLLGRVQRDRVHFVLPLDAGEDVEALLDRLRERLGSGEVDEILAAVAAQPPWSAT